LGYIFIIYTEKIAVYIFLNLYGKISSIYIFKLYGNKLAVYFLNKIYSPTDKLAVNLFSSLYG
jgi:hypothetical protein